MSDPFRLDGKRAVVTGAGKGIGRGIATQLARAGADLVISSRTQEDLDSLADEIGALGRAVTTLIVDVTNPAEVEQLAALAVEQGGIDVWVNNAGGLPDATPRYLTKTPEDRWDAQLDLNLKAVFIACQIAANNMKEGAIINISSSSAKSQGSMKNGPYGASKAAVNSLTQTFALELAPKIRVNAVAPGPVPTKNFNESTNFPEGKPIEKIIGVPLGRLGTPDDIGHAVVFMASPASSWVTGQCLYVTGGT
ncbi:MAG: SDR family oxidoreductase [Pseudomonadales bacterium]|nr:SDR family oxidoreductase [Pseudomonadales bacterium]MBO6566142.1 SDR family oxidoreductase [Pseudomonadales bacterium]MBO6596412.1 SDR family oxidoreductase [Pseudomonadales bacterium]MBO6822892.1 SDR family oxidoreductase [Pseudomonadales bacterium]